MTNQNIQATQALERIMLNYNKWGGPYSKQQTLASLEDYYRTQGMSPALAIQFAADTERDWIRRGVQPTVPPPSLPTYGGQPSATMSASPTLPTLEAQTDPLTAYLQRLGIGGKTAYNPAESYQAGLFEPWKNIYDVAQRVYRPGGALQDPNRQYGSFMDFLSGEERGRGYGTLTSSAANVLRSIFGAPANQKASTTETIGGLGFEPWQGAPSTAGGMPAIREGLEAGNLPELQKLMAWGLRPQQGALGSRYMAAQLPEAQQAYYSQKAAGTPDMAPSFLDWLKQNWGLNF